MADGGSWREEGSTAPAPRAEPSPAEELPSAIGHQLERDALDRAVRLFIFRQTAESGEVPGAADIAGALGEGGAAVEASLRRLAEGRAIVLAPSTTNIWMAAPFSAVPTPFRVRARGRRYWGNCVWDALGVAAILHDDATVETRCGDCADAMALEVRGGVLARGEGVVHFAVPVARWWENVGFT
jgi:hypothetical protein